MRDLKENRTLQPLGQCRDVTVGGPHFQFCITGGAEPDADRRLAALGHRLHPHGGHDLRVTALEPFRQAQEGSQQLYRGAPVAVEGPEPVVRFLGQVLAVIPRGQRDHLDL